MKVNVFGNGSLKVSIFAFYNNTSVQLEKIEGFSYKYNIEEPDVCKFTYKTERIQEVDEPYLQEKVELRVFWGYADGKVSKTRKVYIDSIDYNYTDYGVELSIQAKDKGANLSKGKRSKVKAETTIDELLREMAEENNLKYSPIPLEVDEQTGESTVAAYIDTNGSRQGYLKYNDLGPIQAYSAIENTAVREFAVFEKKVNFIQANKTDKASVEDLLSEVEGGPYVLETRDDTVTLNVRRLNSKPIKSYTYRGEDGELLSFKPQSSHKSSSIKSTKVSAGAWDEASKDFYISSSTEVDDTNTRLGEEVTLPEDDQLAQLIKDGVVDPSDETAIMDIEAAYAVPKKINTSKQSYKDPTTGAYFPAVENTSVVIQTFDLFNPIEYGDYVTGKIQSGDEPEVKVNSTAKNKRTTDSLDSNPGRCILLGDPDIECNQVITILGVGKKHEGNYFIESSEHSLDGSYTITCTLKRNGKGRISQDDITKVSTEDLNKPLNSEVGPDTVEGGDYIELNDSPEIP